MQQNKAKRRQQQQNKSFHLDVDTYFCMQQNKAKRQQQQQQQTHKGVNSRSKCVTQVQQQRPESSTVTLTWHACTYSVHKLRQRYKTTTTTKTKNE